LFEINISYNQIAISRKTRRCERALVLSKYFQPMVSFADVTS